MIADGCLQTVVMLCRRGVCSAASRRGGLRPRRALTLLRSARACSGRAGALTSTLLAGLADVGAAYECSRGLGAEGNRLSAGGDARGVCEGETSEAAPAGAALLVHHVPLPTNMVVFEVQGLKGEWRGPAGAAAFCQQLRRRGVLMFPYGGRGEHIRAVTHRHVDAHGIDRAVAAVRHALASPDLPHME